MDGRILVGTRKGSFLVTKEGGRWRPRLSGHGGQGVNFVTRDPHTGTLWATLGHGHWGAKLSRSEDDGASWSDAPAQIKFPEGARYIEPEMGEPDPAKGPTLKDAMVLKLWYVGFGAPGDIYVGTIPGGLFESHDGGESFELNLPLWNHPSRGGDLFAGEPTSNNDWFGTPAAADSGEFAPGIHSIFTDPRDPDLLRIAVSCAGVIESRDRGKSWAPVNKGMRNDFTPDPEPEWGHDPHYVELCPGSPDHVWQQNHCGVYYSSDGAKSWTLVSDKDQGIDFGFPVVADDEDGRTAWVVPGRSDQQRMAIDGGLFVAHTTDGGASWTPQREGLPQEGAYDVVYRHAFAGTGDLLAFGSTTGNLYVSEDRGATWQTAGNNLPPIYSVRFG